jgi:hypothetical protein
MFSRLPRLPGLSSGATLIRHFGRLFFALSGLLLVTAAVHATDAPDPRGVSRISFSSRMGVGNFGIYLAGTGAS